LRFLFLVIHNWLGKNLLPGPRKPLFRFYISQTKKDKPKTD
jgi:hypothetical protein